MITADTRTAALKGMDLVQIDADTWRACFYEQGTVDSDRHYTDIWEAPFRTLMQWILQQELGDTYAIRKVKS